MANPWENDPIVQPAGNVFTLPPSPQQQAQTAGTQVSTAHTQQQMQQQAQAFPLQQQLLAQQIANAKLTAANNQKKTNDQAQQEQARKVAKMMETDRVLNAIKEARGEIGDWTTGMIGQMGAHVPGILGIHNPAYDLGQDLSTIKSNIAFDAYTKMKENLPQGAQGGLRLTDNELKLLQTLQGSLNQGNAPDKLKNHLNNIEREYRMSAAIAAGLNPNDPNVQRQIGLAPPPPKQDGWKIERMGN